MRPYESATVLAVFTGQVDLSSLDILRGTAGVESRSATADVRTAGFEVARIEMDAVLFRTAMSPGIREQGDCFPMIANRDGKMVVGQLEQVWLPNLELALPARIDTGAETASLDARNIELFT